MFTFSRKGPIQYVESRALQGCGFVEHAFCTRWGGVSAGDFENLNFSFREGDPGEQVRKNWEILAGAFAVPARQFLVVNQVHGDRILAVDGDHPKPSENQVLEYDAIVTDRPGLAIGIKTADCVPILLADRAKRVIGAVHAGWKGTSLAIARQAVDTLVQRYASRPADIVAAIGPAIGPCCYQVDDIVFESMRDAGRGEDFFSPCSEKGRWKLDLFSANRWQLEAAGLHAENISSSGICTACRGDYFFSHRREKGRTGRHLNFILIRGTAENVRAKSA